MPEYIKKWNLQWIIPLLALIVSIVGIPWKDTIESFFPTKLWYYIGHYHPDQGKLITITPQMDPANTTYPRFFGFHFHRCGDSYCANEGDVVEALRPPTWAVAPRVVGRTEPGSGKGEVQHRVSPGECLEVLDTIPSPTASPPEDIGGHYLWMYAHKTDCN